MSEVIFVYIFVIVVDNVFLKFIFKDYFVEISEIVSIGSFVGMVIVYSQLLVVYEIKDGNIGDVFDINLYFGSIIIQKVLDFEILFMYILII